MGRQGEALPQSATKPDRHFVRLCAGTGVPLPGVEVPYLIVSAIVLLSGLSLWLVAGIVITYREPKNAAKIITALGANFPLRKH